MTGKNVCQDNAAYIVKNQKSNSMAQKQAHLASSMHPESFYRGNIESGKDETHVVKLDLSNIPRNMSMGDLKRHLSNFKVIELEATHDVTTGLHNTNANLKLRVKDTDKNRLFEKLNTAGISYNDTKERANGKRDNLYDTGNTKWEATSAKTYAPILKYNSAKEAKMGNLISQGVQFGTNETAGRWNGKWQDQVVEGG